MVERGIFATRSRAAAAVMAGDVTVGTERVPVSKPGTQVSRNVAIELAPGPRYVSRGGLKLEHALEQMQVPVEGRHALDVGASTGGFTDCLLRRGAQRVIAVDVGYGQLDWTLRNDPRVVVLERTNARHLEPDQLPYAPDLATIDVSFISLAKVLPAVAACLAQGGEILALVKPQFELGRGRVRGGVVRAPEERREALLAVAEAAADVGLSVRGFAPSGLPGPKGNRETFIRLAMDEGGVEDLDAAVAEVEA